MDDLVSEYDALIRRILDARISYQADLARAELVRASITEEERSRLEVLHGVDWVNGTFFERSDPWDTVASSV